MRHPEKHWTPEERECLAHCQEGLEYFFVLGQSRTQPGPGLVFRGAYMQEGPALTQARIVARGRVVKGHRSPTGVIIP